MVCVAVAIVRAIAVPGDALEPRTWLALYVATLLSGALTIAFIGGAIAITEGGMSRRTLRQMFVMDGVVTVTNSSLAIAAALVISVDPRALPVLLVPTVTVFAVYRAYVSERQRHEKLEFLYEANRTLSNSPEVAEAIEGLLERSLEAFRSEIAEVVLFGADGTPLRSAFGPADSASRWSRRNETRRRSSRRWSTATSGRVARPAGESAAAALLEPRRPQRHGRDASRGEPDDRRDHAREPLRDRARIQPRGSPPARGAGQQRERGAAVRPARAGRRQAAEPPGAAPSPGVPRPTDRSPEPDAVHGSGQAARRGEGRIAVLFIDVDDFKIVNDSLGHDVGDSLLVSVAGRLRHSVRPQDLVARLGGDEFAVMLPAVEDPESAGRAVATRILQAFELPVLAGPELLSVHVSVGIADSRECRDADDLIRHADLAMYQAKSKGKTRYEFFEPSMADAMLRLHDVKEELAKAIEREEIVVEYQPIVSLPTGRRSPRRHSSGGSTRCAGASPPRSSCRWRRARA